MKFFIKAFIILQFIFAINLMANSESGILPNTKDAVQVNGTGKGHWEKRVYSGYVSGEKEKKNLSYQIFIPEIRVDEKEVPLVVVLHGAGEKGTDNEAQMYPGSKGNWGPLFFSNKQRQKEFPCYVIAPQAAPGIRWVGDGPGGVEFEKSKPTQNMQLLTKLIKSTVRKNKHIDRERIYISGMSMGGQGAYYLSMSNPKLFAAMIVMCAYEVRGGAERIMHQGIRLYYAFGDKIVQPFNGTNMNKYFENIELKQPQYRFKMYDAGTHGTCWADAYAEPDFQSWLFSWRNRNVDKFNTQYWAG